MNKWHVIHIIRKVRDEQRMGPWGDRAITALALAIAFFLPLATADFKDAFSVGKATWQALDILGVGMSLFAALVCGIRWALRRFGPPMRSEEQIVQGLIDEMSSNGGRLIPEKVRED